MQSWESFLDKVEQDLGKQVVDKWLRSLKVVRFDAANLYLEAKDSFQILWFEEHLRARTSREFLNNNRRRIRIHLRVAQDVPEPLKPKAKKASSTKEKKAAADAAPRLSLQFSEWDPHCRFDTFVCSESNTLPFRVLTELVGIGEQPLELATFNPIFLWGPSGTGKTHLLTAAAQALQEEGYRVRYTHAETFTEHVVSAIRAGEMHRFRQAYRDIDVLLIDDIQIFSRKRATQEEFFHTFNTLHVENKQIILAADVAPNELQSIEPRLVSRFEWGIVLSLDKAQPDLLREILLAKAMELGVQLNEKVVNFLLEHFPGKTKALIRALEALILRSHMSSPSRHGIDQMGVAEVEVHLKDLLAEEVNQQATPDRIINTVAAFYGIRREDILSKSQSRECVMPRKIAMHLCRDVLRLPYMAIGRLFGRDHSTVMSSVKQIKKSLGGNSSTVAAPINSIRKKLQLQ